MENERLQVLLNKYIQERCTDAESIELDEWFHTLNYNNVDFNKWMLESGGADIVAGNLYEDFKNRYIPNPKVKSIRLFYKLIAAAAAISGILIGVYFFKGLNHSKSLSRSEYVNDVAPGENKATITLANGKTIVLSDAKTGVVISNDNLAYNDGTEVALLSPSGRDGLAREGSNNNNPLSPQEGSLPEGERSKVQILTATTPRGGTYQVTLSDGTKVWLNADSKISFPSKFSGKERRVMLKGEVYLEVAKDKSHPFIVTCKGQEIEVLGTHFNVSSYPDEPIRTTLAEGSVKVLAGQDFKIIRPGQQTVVEKKGITVHDVDIDGVIAWKNGDFDFNSESITNVMSTLSRWYDIDVNYEGQVKENSFTGRISRNRNISQVLKMLEQTKRVHFKVEGRRVTVME